MATSEIIEQVKSETAKIEATKGATPEEQNVINTLDFFDKYDDSQYKTYDDAKELLDSDLNPEVLQKIITEFSERKANDKRFKEEGGRNLNLANDTFNNLFKKLEKTDIETAKDLTFTNLSDNYNNIKEFLDSDDVFKLAGINPDEGSPANARLSFSFGLQKPEFIKDAAHNAIVYTLPKDKRELYTGLNYKGPKIHVDNYTFDDGKSRLIYKVPKELGGDEKFRLFNEPGEWSKDIVGYTPQIVQLLGDATAGYFTAAGGPNAVAAATAASSFATEYARLKIGQLFFNQNKNISDADILTEALKFAGVSGAATRVFFPIANLINRTIRTTGAFAGLSGGNISNKIIGDFVDAYKKGLNKDVEVDAAIKELKNQLTKSVDEGGAGLSKSDADVLVKKQFAENLPGTRVANLDVAVREGSKGQGMAKQAKVSGELDQAAIDAEKIGLNVQKKVLSDITGIDIKKIGTLDTASDAFKTAEAIAKSNYRANLIRQEDFTQKFLGDWKKISGKYQLKLNPEENNFNVVLQKFLEPIKTINYSRSQELRGTINELTKDLTVSIPKTNIKKGFVSPVKIFDTTIKDFNSLINKNKKILSDIDTKELYDVRNLLKNLKVQFTNKKSFKYLELEETLQQLEFIKGKYPQVAKQLTQVETSLRSARSQLINKLPPNQAKLITGQMNEFMKTNSILKEDVLGKVISNLKGVRGPVAKNKALTAPDQFDVLFGNSQEQIAALRYIKSAADGNLNKVKLDDLKSIMYDKFIRDVTPVAQGGNGLTTKKFLTKYGKAYQQIFSKAEMNNFNNIIKARKSVEKIVENTLSMNQKAKNIFPALKGVDVTNITPNRIVNELFNPNITPKKVNNFFKSIGPSNANVIKSYYLQNLFNSVKTKSPILARDTLDGTKLVNFLNQPKNEQVFTNIFGADATKNVKTVGAALSFMQNTSRYIGKEMTEAAQDKVRTTAFQIVYGPLAHENVVVRNLIRLMNLLDNKLGKEFLDYDMFVEKFKKTYALKYAPALNDKKFMKFFNTYDADLLQKGYTGSVSALSTSFAQGEESLEEAGLPTSPLEAVPNILLQIPVEKVTENVPSLESILDFLTTKPKDKSKQETLKKIRKLKDE